MVRQAGAGRGRTPENRFSIGSSLKQLGDTPEKDLGKKDIDGKPASGFVAKQDGRTFTIWIDDASGAGANRVRFAIRRRPRARHDDRFPIPPAAR